MAKRCHDANFIPSHLVSTHVILSHPKPLSSYHVSSHPRARALFLNIIVQGFSGRMLLIHDRPPPHDTCDRLLMTYDRASTPTSLLNTCKALLQDFFGAQEKAFPASSRIAAARPEAKGSLHDRSPRMKPFGPDSRLGKSSFQALSRALLVLSCSKVSLVDPLVELLILYHRPHSACCGVLLVLSLSRVSAK